MMKRRALFALVVLVGFAALSEGIARVGGGRLFPARRSLDAMPGEPVPNEPNMVVDAATGWRPRTGAQKSFGIPGGTTVNSRGLRGPEVPLAKPAGTRRVLLVGDSTVFGVLVSDTDTFAARLEGALQRVDPGIHVLNGAAPGWSSWQARRALETGLLDYEPDLVVIATLWSDAQGARLADAERFSPLLPVLDRSRGFILLREWVRELRSGPEVEEVRVDLRSPGTPPAGTSVGAPGGSGTPPGAPSGGQGGARPIDDRPPLFGPGGAPTLRVPLADYTTNLEAMAADVRAVGGQAAFLVLPCVRDPVGGKVGDFRDDYRAAMRAVAGRLDAPLADTPAAFVGRSPTAEFFDEVHPTAHGHTLIADVLARALEGWARDGAVGRR